MSTVDLDRHCHVVARRLAEGRVIPFLGAGAGLCGRPADANWREGSYLPSGSELAAHLAESYAYPDSEQELVRVSQYVELTAGDAVLFEELHSIFAGAYAPNKLHTLLAELPGLLRERGCQTCGQVVITTNYDDALERAFERAGEPVDVVCYVEAADEPGTFVHVRSGGDRVPITRHEYRDFDVDSRSLILKIHGAVDRTDASRDSYVITEDDYIEYLAVEDISRLIPAYLMARMRTSHFLFLGYGLKDWNFRVILHKIWSQQVRHFASWAIQLGSGEIERRLWDRHGVELLDASLEDWVDAMREQLR
jgi:hypothetical protein